MVGSGQPQQFSVEVATTPAPILAPPTIYKFPKYTTAPKIIIRGIIFVSGCYVQYAVGKQTAKFRGVKNGAKWKIILKLEFGRNIFYFRVVDPSTGRISKVKKIIIFRF